MQLMGPPGVGKGTVAERLKTRLGFRHLSTGNLLREAIDKGTELGLQAKGNMSRGELVPDGVIMALVGALFDKHGRGDYLLDGFPRTLAQARMLDEGLAGRGTKVEAVIVMEAPDRVVLERLGGRRVCGPCGAGYHAVFIPPRREGICDRCGGALVQRADDREEAIVRRLAVYASQMDVLRPYYRDLGVLVPVDATGTPEQTEARILKALGRG